MLFYQLQLLKVKSEISELSSNPQGLLSVAVHSAGFSGPLANPLLAPESAVDRLDSTILEEFVNVSLRNLSLLWDFLYLFSVF